MNPDRKRLFIALGLGLTAALLAFLWLHLQERQLLHQGEEIQVLAPKHYLPAYTRLQANQLYWQHLPRAFAPVGAVTDATAVLGLQTLVPFNAEEPLIFNKLALGEQSLAASVPEGKRAVSVAVNAVTGLSGMLKAGDHVDVLLLHGQGSAAQAGLLLQDVSVLAVGATLTRAENSRAESASTVTLALVPDEAVLALAASANGQLSLVLRASGDTRPVTGTHANFSDALRRLDRAPTPPKASAEPPADAFVPHKR